MRVELVDVGPRDGLQNEDKNLSPEVRAELCDRLAEAGVPRVEAASFVNPKRVPQMAGAEEVLAKLERRPGTVYAGLVLNEKGYERAVQAGVDEVRYAFPVTETFAKEHQNTTVGAATELAGRLVERARLDGVRVSVTLSAAFGCPFEGRVEPGHVLDIARQVAGSGPDEIVLADTIGVGVPSQVGELVGGVSGHGVTVGCHFHDTRNTGIANAAAAVKAGATVLDASVGGTGGCPFAPRATGNIATEDLVYLLHGMGLETGIELRALVEVAGWLAGQLGKELPGQVYKAASSSRSPDRRNGGDAGRSDAAGVLEGGGRLRGGGGLGRDAGGLRRGRRRWRTGGVVGEPLPDAAVFGAVGCRHRAGPVRGEGDRARRDRGLLRRRDDGEERGNRGAPARRGGDAGGDKRLQRGVGDQGARGAPSRTPRTSASSPSRTAA